jgi:hypothetical protein
MTLLKKDLPKEIQRVFKLNMISKKEDKTLEIIRQCISEEISEYILEEWANKDMFLNMGKIMEDVRTRFKLVRQKGIPDSWYFSDCFIQDYDQFDEKKFNMDKILKTLLDQGCLKPLDQSKKPPTKAGLHRTLSFLLRVSLNENNISDFEDILKNIKNVDDYLAEVNTFQGNNRSNYHTILNEPSCTRYLSINYRFRDGSVYHFFSDYYGYENKELRAVQKQIKDKDTLDYLSEDFVSTFIVELKNHMRELNLSISADILSNSLLATVQRVNNDSSYKSSLKEKLLRF